MIVITGPSGAGKGTLIHALIGRISELELAISATTRHRRKGEEDGREYYFLADGDFAKRVAEGDFLEHVTYVSGQRYGTLRSEIGRIAAAGHVAVLELETEGALKVAEEVPHAVTIFVTAPVDGARAAPARARHRERGRDRRAARPCGEPAASRRHCSTTSSRTTRWSEPCPSSPQSSAATSVRLACPANDQYTHRHAARNGRLSLRLVIVAAKRARQINNYHHQLGEGTFDELPPLVESRSKNYLTMAFEEIARARSPTTYPRARRRSLPRRPRAGTMCSWRGSFSVSPVASPPTRRASSADCSSRPGTTSRRCSRPGPSASSPRETFEALARRETPRELYPHLVDADLLVIAPLTANTLAKLAHGLADNVLTQAALAFRGPVLVAPAMNVRMWEHPATQANADAPARAWRRADRARTRASSPRARSGAGRMTEPEEIFARCRVLLGEARPLCTGKRVLVSAGGTREPLDAVRFLGNRSSGRMGVALAEEARRRGADVTLLAANLAVPAACRHRGRRDADRGRPGREALRARGRGRRRSWPPPSPTTGRPSHERQAAEGRRALDGRARADDGRARGARRRPRRTARCSSASAPTTASDGLEREAREARRRRTSTSSSTTTCARRNRVRRAPTTRSCSCRADGERHGRTPRRPRSRRRSSTRSSGSLGERRLRPLPARAGGGA